MTKEENKQETKVVEQPKKEVSLQEATTEQLEALGFRIDHQIKNLQRQYQTVINELQSRAEK